MTFTIRCLTGTTVHWSERFSREDDATHYYEHKMKEARYYGAQARAYRFELWQAESLIDEFETTQMGDGE